VDRPWLCDEGFGARDIVSEFGVDLLERGIDKHAPVIASEHTSSLAYGTQARLKVPNPCAQLPLVRAHRLHGRLHPFQAPGVQQDLHDLGPAAAVYPVK
jgi:hypothetical protein